MKMNLNVPLRLVRKIIGVNNRNLHDLTVDLNRVVELTKKNTPTVFLLMYVLLANQAFTITKQIHQLQKVAHGFLIGSSLMGNQDLNNAVRSVIFGENKVCGLTRAQDVKIVYENGALYGGLIFAEHSKRCEFTPSARISNRCSTSICWCFSESRN